MSNKIVKTVQEKSNIDEEAMGSWVDQFRIEGQKLGAYNLLIVPLITSPNFLIEY